MTNTSEKDNTKNKILKSSLRLLRKQSYNSFSYNDIAEEVNIRKASIHYHFPTKDVLGVETVQYFYQKTIQYITMLEESTQDPVAKIEAFFDYFQGAVARNYMCPGLVLSVEFHTLSKEMQDELQKLFTYYIEWLSEILEQGRKEGKFDFNESPEEKAIFVASAVEGGMVFARAHNKADYFKTTVEQLKNSILSK